MRIHKDVAACLIALFLPLIASGEDGRPTNHHGTFFSNRHDVTATIGNTSQISEGSYLVGISGSSGFGFANDRVGFPRCGTCAIPIDILNQPGFGYTKAATFELAGTFAAKGTPGMIFSSSLNSATSPKRTAATFSFQDTILNTTSAITRVSHSTSSAATSDRTANDASSIDNGKRTVSFTNDRGIMSLLAPATEPGTLALLGTGLIAIALVVRRVAG